MVKEKINWTENISCIIICRVNHQEGNHANILETILKMFQIKRVS